MPKALKYIVGGAAGAGITTLLIGGTAFAADADPVATSRRRPTSCGWSSELYW